MLDILRDNADDGLIIPEIGPWADRKYKLIHQYAEMFSSSMKKKWDCRVYIDLFAGAGRAKIKGSKRIVKGSPILALSVKEPFDRYIFCEIDPGLISALSERVEREFPSEDVKYVVGDANQKIDEILDYIPKANKQFKVLSFCLIDPFKLSSLNFKTVKKLAEKYMDFLVLVACGMDAQRNEKAYMAHDSKVIECFLGNSCWRNEWVETKSNCDTFSDFVVESFGRGMAKLGYIPVDLNDTVLVRQPKNKSPLYRLAFFSRSELGRKFWLQARKYSDPQRKLELKWN